MARYRTEFRRVEYLPDCDGKTVAAVECTGYAAGFRFSDGTYVWFCSHDDGFGEAELDCVHTEPGPEDALALGIIDRAEYDRVQAEQTARREADDRVAYEALRARFDPPAG